MKSFLALFIVLTLTASAQQPEIPQIPTGYWPESKSKEILDKTIAIRLAPDLSRLSAEEKAALKPLLEAGRIMQRLYEDAKHHEALTSYDNLRTLDARLGSPPRTKNLRTLFRLFQGPIATTLDNKREAFLPVAPERPGKNVYPLDATKADLDAFIAAHPELRENFLDPRTVVRRETKTNLGYNINVLQAFP